MPEKNLLIIGAGGVAEAVAKKCARFGHALGDVMVASRGVDKCARIVADLESEAAKAVDGGRAAPRFAARKVDAKDIAQTAALIAEWNAGIVLNAASPHVNLAVMDACLQAGAHYIDTAVYEREGELNMPPPWYAANEWRKRGAFAAKKLTAILSAGFDPGAVNAFCAHIRRELLDRVDSIDIMDVNAGDHGRHFATNFDPETNLREIMEAATRHENGEWRAVAPHSRFRDFDFPEVGRRRVFSMGHEEVHSLAQNIPARRIEFWMGFSERYLQVFAALNNIGLLSPAPVRVEDAQGESAQVAPIKMVKAVLPNPRDLAAGYKGSVCIGCLGRGEKNGKRRAVFVYSVVSHEAAFADIGAQAVSYTTAVPAVAAALLIAEGPWRANRMVNVEELDPAPFLAKMSELGIGWETREEDPDAPDDISESEV